MKYKVGDVLTSDVFGCPNANVYVAGPNIREYVAFFKRRRVKIRVGYVICETNPNVCIYPYFFQRKSRFIPMSAKAILLVNQDGTISKKLIKTYCFHVKHVLNAWGDNKFSIVSQDDNGQFNLLESDEFWQLNQRDSGGLQLGTIKTSLRLNLGKRGKR